jgi:Mg2+ and Co2+ transporter CorA
VRRLMAWAAILAVPTAIAGIYGMKFEHMPEPTYGYYMNLFRLHRAVLALQAERLV